MIPANRRAEVDDADAFLRGRKRLTGSNPEWTPSTFGNEWTAIWAIEDEEGITRASLRFCASLGRFRTPSVSLILRRYQIWRVDLEEPTICKPNPLGAERLGLPAQVCGSHCHGWPDNRDYLLSQDMWHLPFRRPITPRIRKLEQVVPWLADQINLSLEADQYGFGLPSQGRLF